MFTDMVGYTALSQRKEALAVELLDEHRNVIRPFFSKHNGTEIKTMGDAFLVEFASALEAVRCAFDIQQSLRKANSARPSDKKIQIRIGIHLGDVIHSQSDVYGDAVNIASRIESVAVAGGICVTEQVYDQIKNKFEFPLSSLGKKELKNVEEQMEVYKVLLPWDSSGRNTEAQPAAINSHRIAVLPFANISADSKDEYFADGMTEEIITALSRITGLSVISRTSVMRYKASTKAIEEIREELRVESVLEGSVRKAGDRLRISVQLIDATKDKNLWAEAYDRKTRDVFAIQTEIAKKVASSLRVRLLRSERERIEGRRTTRVEAYSAYLLGRFHLNKHTVEDTYKAIEKFKEVLRLDPNYAPAYAGLSDCYTYLGDNAIRPAEAFPKSKDLAAKALELDENLAEAHLSLALVLYEYEWDWSGAEREFKRAIDLNPSLGLAFFWYTAFLAVRGRLDEGIPLLRRARELDPLNLTVRTGVGGAAYFARDFDGAIKELREVLEMDPNFAIARERLALSYLAKSEFDKAVSEFQKLCALLPGNPLAKGLLGYAYASIGNRGEAQRLMQELYGESEHEYVSPFAMALVHLGLGENDRVFELLEQAYRDHSTYFSLAGIKAVPPSCSPLYDEIRSNARFGSLLSKLGLVV